MKISAKLTKASVAIAATIALVGVGVCLGVHWSKYRGIQRELNDSLLQIALNLESARYMREGKQSNAIDLINANIDAELVYLMRYDDFGSSSPEFSRLKKRVLTKLGREWSSYPRPHGGNDGSFYSDPEWQQYQQEVESYLKKNLSN